MLKLYAQAISLPQLSYFGIGPDTTSDAHPLFGQREMVIGMSVICPGTATGETVVGTEGFCPVTSMDLARRQSSADQSFYDEAHKPPYIVACG